MFTMKDLGHTLPGHLLVHQNQTFANSRCYYLKKTYKNHINHSVNKQPSKFAKYVCVYTKGPFPTVWPESFIHSTKKR